MNLRWKPMCTRCMEKPRDG